MNRPDFIRNQSELSEEPFRIAKTGELLSRHIQLSHGTALAHMRLELEILAPGRRASSPHAHTTQEEFIYVLEGNPDIWIDGILYPLKPGDTVALAAGTGLAHTVINNGASDARYLTIAASGKDADSCFYPHHEPSASDPPIFFEWAKRNRDSAPPFPIDAHPSHQKTE